MKNLFLKKKASKGQSLAEYGLILALIAVVCLTALDTLGNNISAGLTSVSTGIADGMDGTYAGP